jgi:hypothetical protein
MYSANGTKTPHSVDAFGEAGAGEAWVGQIIRTSTSSPTGYASRVAAASLTGWPPFPTWPPRATRFPSRGHVALLIPSYCSLPGGLCKTRLLIHPRATWPYFSNFPDTPRQIRSNDFSS